MRSIKLATISKRKLIKIVYTTIKALLTGYY